MPSSVGDDLVVRLRAGHPGQLEAVADLDALDGLDAHQRGREPGVEPPVPVHVRAEADRHAVRQHLDDAAEGVAVLVGLVDLRDHRLATRPRPGSAPGRRRASRRRPGSGTRRTGPSAAASSTTWRDDLDARRLLQVRAGDRAERDPGGGLPGAGALQDRPGLVEAVLLHARQVGVTGPRAGSAARCGPARPASSGSTGSAAMTCSHFGHSVLPTMIATGEPMRQPVPHAAEEGDLVALELHPGTAAVAEAPPGQVVRHHLRGDRHAGGKPLQRRHQCGSVRLPRGQPAQPAQRCSSCSRLELRRRDRVRGPGPPPPILPRPRP